MSKGKREILLCVQTIAIVLCLLAYIGYSIFCLGKNDGYIYGLIFFTVVVSYIPYARKVNLFGGSIDLDRLKENVRKVESITYRTKLLKAENNEHYYIDRDGIYHKVTESDPSTVKFFEAVVGKAVDLTFEEIKKNYGQGKETGKFSKEVVFRREEGRDYYAIMSGVKYYIGSWATFVDLELADIDGKAATKTSKQLAELKTGL